MTSHSHNCSPLVFAANIDSIMDQPVTLGKASLKIGFYKMIRERERGLNQLSKLVVVQFKAMNGHSYFLFMSNKRI